MLSNRSGLGSGGVRPLGPTRSPSPRRQFTAPLHVPSRKVVCCRPALDAVRLKSAKGPLRLPFVRADARDGARGRRRRLLTAAASPAARHRTQSAIVWAAAPRTPRRVAEARPRPGATSPRRGTSRTCRPSGACAGSISAGPLGGSTVSTACRRNYGPGGVGGGLRSRAAGVTVASGGKEGRAKANGPKMNEGRRSNGERGASEIRERADGLVRIALAEKNSSVPPFPTNSISAELTK